MVGSDSEDLRGALSSEQQLLLHRAYELDRQDDGRSTTSLYTLLGSGFLLVGILVTLLSKTGDRPWWVIALAPVLPLPLVGFSVLHIAESVVRGIVIDAEEAQLRRARVAVAVPFPQEINSEELAALTVPSSHTLTGRLWGGWRGKAIAAIAVVVFVTGYVTLLAASFSYEHKRHAIVAIPVLVFCIAGFGVIWATAWVAARPTKWLNSELHELNEQIDGAGDDRGRG